MNEIVLISISGDDKPGLTASLMSILAQHNINVLDMGQAVIHNSLALGIMVEMPDDDAHASVLKDLLFHIHELDLQARFTPISTESYQQWVDAHGKPRYIVTLLARQITAEHIKRLSVVTSTHNLNIENIQRLSGRIPLGEVPVDSKACIEFTVRGEVLDSPAVRRSFLELATEMDIDIAFQEDTVYRRNRRLVCFDMDSTLIETEVIDELAILAGVGAEVSGITEKAMQGELDFKQSLRQRVALLEGLDESAMQDVAERLPVTEGAERLVSSLSKLGYSTAILSGGFDYFGRHLQEKLGIDYVYANQLEIVNGKLTGKVIGEIVDGDRKASLLRTLADKERISLQQVIAVGDGANDLPMLSIAGLGIAFRAKPVVQRTAEHSISTLGLDGILYLLGFSDNQKH